MPPTSPEPASPVPANERSRLARACARYVAFAERRTGLLLGLLALLGLASLYPTLRLELHTDMAELLPDDHPSVAALRRISGKQKASTNLVLLIESPDAEANRRFAAALRPDLDRMVPSVFTEIQWQPDNEIPDYAARWRWLYADLDDLAHAEELLDRLIQRRGVPVMVDLDDSDPEQELRALRKKLEDKVPKRREEAHFSGVEEATPKAPKTHLIGVMLWKRGDGLAGRGDQETLDGVDAVVRRIDPKRFHPAMQVEYTGHIAMAIDEANAIRDDLTLATTLCTTLVLLSILLYFRRILVLWVVGAPAILGLLLALALAQLTVHFLNANTAFLISIILGNGINSPIILMARYGEERRRGREVGPALGAAMAGAMLATGTAMAAAAIAYGSLLATSFRGFSQFGLVGGSGMLLVWIMTFLLLPPMVIFGERLRPGSLTPRPNPVRRPFAWLGGLAVRRPGLLALGTVALVAAAALPLARYLRDPMEWNFGNLRNAETRAGRNWQRMHGLGLGSVGAGHIATDGVLLVDKPEQADAVAEALWRQDERLGEGHVLKAVRTISTSFPATSQPPLPRSQAEKLEVLGRIRSKIDRHRALMSDEERAEAEKFRPPDTLRLLTADDLPQRVRDDFTEVGGVRGRFVGIDADPRQYSDWNGRDLMRLARSMRVEALGQTWVVASSATVFAGMLETIVDDAPRVTLIALAGVALLVLLAFGVRGAPPVLLTMFIGLVWLGGLLALIQLKLNFVNFVAVPITLGVGTDYAANIWARLKSDGPSRLAEIVADTGSAVALCSLTTIIGYSSLLLASNRALKSFGLLADLGEVTCLLAALVALPALAQLMAKRRAARGQAIG
ncbi:MAG: hypothetical protein EXR72_23535 [Myxococcales bacterium]|nr:hypothetical protein [Myxococcales bacterium]